MNIVSNSIILHPRDLPDVNIRSRKGKEPFIKEDEGWSSDWTGFDSEDGDYKARSEEKYYESDTSLEYEQIQREIGDYYVFGDDENVNAIDPNDRIYDRKL